jgi:hypothetical protein
MNTATVSVNESLKSIKYNAIFIALAFKTVTQNTFRFNENERDNQLLSDFEYSDTGQSV